MTQETEFLKAQQQFQQLCDLMRQAGREGWRTDHIERQAMPELMRVGREFLSGHVESQGTGDRGENEKELGSEEPKTVREGITCFENNQEHMCYDTYLAAGYPIGSGVAEGACRQLVKDRLELTGMRWERKGAQSMLHLRAIYLNGEGDEFVDFRLKRRQAALYGSGTVYASVGHQAGCVARSASYALSAAGRVRRETLVALLSSQQRSHTTERRARSCSAGVGLVSDTELAGIVGVMATRMKRHIFQNSTPTRRPRSA